jgi:hypothetical protein
VPEHFWPVGVHWQVHVSGAALSPPNASTAVAYPAGQLGTEAAG